MMRIRMKTTFIYVLKDPSTGVIRYVGKSNDPKRRTRKHLADTDDSHKTRWIKSLLIAGTKPELEIVDEVPFEHWPMLEAAYMEFFRERGCDLVNTSPGGFGGSTRGRKCLPFTPEHCANISAALTGRKLSLGHRANCSAGHTGKKHSPEWCAAISAGLMGKKLSLEHRAALSLAQTLRQARARQEKALLC